MLFALALGGVTFVELRAITKRLSVVEAADDLLSTMLEVRRYEKNFLLYKDEASARSLRRYLAVLREGIGAVEAGATGEAAPDTFAAVRATAASYEAIFDELSRREARQVQAESEVLERMRGTARDLQVLVEDISRRERSGVDALLRRGRRAIRLLPIALLVAILVGVGVDAGLSRSIAAPIRELEDLTHTIAAGDFSRRIAVAGEDEFSSLGRSFNRMQDRLHDTLTTLELANQELRSNRARLLEAERFAALGRFAAGVAHEINNPLAVINEQAGLLKDYLALPAASPERERFAGPLETITESVARCSAITHRILNFAGSPEVIAEEVDVNALVGEVLKELQPQLLAKHVLLSLDLRENLPATRTGRAQLRQAFGDVIRGRVPLLPRGGTITVSTAMQDPQSLRIMVRDTGPGLGPEMLEHLSQPFSTTRAVGLDPGLGLWISHGIMRKLGGDLLVGADAGGGTVFTFAVPLEPPTAGRESV
jgi:C4-dicarboxylate-specific signal transduction histidine kinase